MNIKLMHMPYRDYQKLGATGTVKSVVREISIVTYVQLENTSIEISYVAGSDHFRLFQT